MRGEAAMKTRDEAKASGRVEVSRLAPGRRFWVVGTELRGKVLSVTECAVKVEVERGPRAFDAHDNEGREVRVELGASSRRFTIARSTVVEPLEG